MNLELIEQNESKLTDAIWQGVNSNALQSQMRELSGFICEYRFYINKFTCHDEQLIE